MAFCEEIQRAVHGLAAHQAGRDRRGDVESLGGRAGDGCRGGRAVGPDRDQKGPSGPGEARPAALWLQAEDQCLDGETALLGRRRPNAATIASRFTLAEQAVLAVVAVEVKQKASCTSTISHLAALAGVSDQTVRNALRHAETLCLVTIEERRRTAWMNHPNKVCIVSKEWSLWLRLLYESKFVEPTNDSEREERESASRSCPRTPCMENLPAWTFTQWKRGCLAGPRRMRTGRC